MGRKLGATIGEVSEVSLFEFSGQNNHVLKAKVKLNLNNPLKKGVNMGSKVDGIHWVDFRYERLPNFCYYCGIIGHNKEACNKRTSDAERGKNESKNLGPWLRTNVGGRRIESASSWEDKEDIV